MVGSEAIPEVLILNRDFLNLGEIEFLSFSATAECYGISANEVLGKVPGEVLAKVRSSSLRTFLSVGLLEPLFLIVLKPAPDPSSNLPETFSGTLPGPYAVSRGKVLKEGSRKGHKDPQGKFRVELLNELCLQHAALRYRLLLIAGDAALLGGVDFGTDRCNLCGGQRHGQGIFSAWLQSQCPSVLRTFSSAKGKPTRSVLFPHLQLIP